MPILLTRKQGGGGGGVACPPGEECVDTSTVCPTGYSWDGNACVSDAIQRQTDYDAHVAASSPRVYYKVDDASGALQDSSANNLDMTTNTNVAYRTDCAGPLGPGDFCGGWGAGSVISRAVVTTATNNVSLEMWVLPLGLVNGGVLFQNGNTVSGYNVLQLTGDKFGLVMPNSAGPFASTGVMTEGQWSYIVVVRDAGTWKYYLNGAVDNASVSAAAPVSPAGNTSIGASASTTNAGGLIVARYAIYETALSAATISARYAIATT